MTRLAAWLVARGPWVIGAVVIVSVVLGLSAARVELAFRDADLLPQDHPFIAVHNRWHKNFSEANVLTVMVAAREGTIFTVPILTKIWQVTEGSARREESL